MLVSRSLVTLVSLALALSPSFIEAAPFHFQGRNRPGPGNNLNQGCSVSVSTKLVTVTMTANPGNTPAPANPVNNNNGGKGQATTTTAPKPVNTPPSNNNNNGNGATTKKTSTRPSNTAAPPPVNNGGAVTTAKPSVTAAPVQSSGGLPVTSISSQTLRGATTLNNAVSTTAGTAPATPTGNTGDNSDPQTSLNLDPRVIGSNFANDGQDEPTEGQVPSLTSTNNFINYCLTLPNTPITDGQQLEGGSCNPVPIGAIPSTAKMPSSKFVSPPNFSTLKANEPFTVSMAIKNLVSGNFVNAKKSYFAAPQQLDRSGTIVGHTHITIERINSFDDTTVLDPKKFEFFKGLNGKDQNGILTADVTKGLTPGFYRLASINAAANHQPVIVPVAQHGSLDDMVYFEVTESGQPSAGNNPVPVPPENTATVAPSSSPVAASTSAKADPRSTVVATSSAVANPISTAVSSPLPAATATTSVAANPTSTTAPNQGNQGGNLQKFRGALGGLSAPAVRPGGRNFVVEGSNDFLNVEAALQRSCDIQKNKCADAANASRNAGFTVADCEKQAGDCRAAR